MAWFSMQAVFFVMNKVFKVERYKAPPKFRELGVHEMKELVKEEENLESLAKSMVPTQDLGPKDEAIMSSEVSKGVTALDKEDVEVALEK